MGQAGLFDFDVACDRLNKKNAGGKDPLLELNRYIDWEIFKEDLLELQRTRRKAKIETGRKPFDVILMLKILILQALYNLSDEAMEFQIRDRISFMRFLGLSFASRVPDARTIWRFRDELAKADIVEKLFSRFDERLRESGLIAYGGQIVDATIVEAPIQRNKKDEDAQIKEGKVPENWSEKKRRHKDTDARWTKKNNVSYYGYKNHVQVDVGSKVVRNYAVTAASTHDSQVFEEILDHRNTSRDVYADSAYRAPTILEYLKAGKFREHIQRRNYRNKKLTAHEKQGNRTRSHVRSRIEHIFGIMSKRAMNLTVRAIGYISVKASIGLRNLAYNMTRSVWLEKHGGHRIAC